MTIEAQDSNALWLRCATGTGDVALIQIDANTGNLLIDAYHPDADEAQCTLTIPPAEVLALGYMLVAMAQRQMAKDDIKPKLKPGEYFHLPPELQRKLSIKTFSPYDDRFLTSARLDTILKNNGLEYVGDIVAMSEMNFRRLPGCGRKTLNEVKELLYNLNLCFDTDVSDWRRPTPPMWRDGLNP